MWHACELGGRKSRRNTTLKIKILFLAFFPKIVENVCQIVCISICENKPNKVFKQQQQIFVLP
jgi:hypothetical protein